MHRRCTSTASTGTRSAPAPARTQRAAPAARSHAAGTADQPAATREARTEPIDRRSAPARDLVRGGFPAVVLAAVVAGERLELDAALAHALVAQARVDRRRHEPRFARLLDLRVPRARRVERACDCEGTELAGEIEVVTALARLGRVAPEPGEVVDHERVGVDRARDPFDRLDATRTPALHPQEVPTIRPSNRTASSSWASRSRIAAVTASGRSPTSRWPQSAIVRSGARSRRAYSIPSASGTQLSFAPHRQRHGQRTSSSRSRGSARINARPAVSVSACWGGPSRNAFASAGSRRRGSA